MEIKTAPRILPVCGCVMDFFFLAPQTLENAFHTLNFHNWIQKHTVVSAFNSRRLGDHSVRCILSSWSKISLQFQFSHFPLGQNILAEHKSVLKSWCVRKIQRAPSSHPGFLLSSHRLTLLCSAGTCFLHWWIFGNPPVLDILQMNWSHLCHQGSEWSAWDNFLSTAERNVKKCFPSDFEMTNY